MRVVLDYGGVLVDHVDEREYAHLLGVSPDRDPYPGWLAYYCFRTGFLDSQAQYVDLLSTLTGATESACREYIDRTWLDPRFPNEREEVLEAVASRHSLVLFSNMVKPWVERVLRRHGVWDVFDSVLVSSELERPKPHPRGYHRCVDGVDGEVVMVSDEFNEDLLMARCFGMTTVWVENDDVVPYQQPAYTIDDLTSLPAVLERIERNT
ncbi:HAD family hydrolase [Halovivax gelatinilyticus]|uniref:HAD family hydrolase n=1 Tax=Halovivax gelatinilyticus TaxID=2961597 RepID=UPI0020CA62F2|nr:HAD family hydrolase [Halovivax gelatinilyticus]